MIPRTLFSPEHELFRDQVRRFIETEITPHHAQWERDGIVPRDLWLKAGAAGLLCAAPPYTRPTQEGIAAHVRAVAHAADLPVILYDVPGRVGIAVADETVARLHESGLVAAIKDAAGDLSRPARLRVLCGGGLIQFSGDDATAPAHRAMGGHGCISASANVVPRLCARLHAAWDQIDPIEFARLRDLLAPLHQALFSESNPIPLKAALCMAGLCNGDLRLPLTRARSGTLDVLGRMLPALMDAEDSDAALPRLIPAALSGDRSQSRFSRAAAPPTPRAYRSAKRAAGITLVT